VVAGEPEWPVGLPTRLRPVGVAGRGISATVWRARDRRHGRDVAVKVLDTGDPRRAELHRARLELEGRALARLRDVPGVVTVHELGVTADGVGWLVTEFVEEGSLAEVGPASMTIGQLHPIALALAGTLAEVHDREVVHGDLSPANLLVGADGRPRLADFGLAALQPHPVQPGGLTPAFAAPERLAGAPPSAAGDVHALAASLAWVMVTDDGGGRLADVLAEAQHAEPDERPDARELALRLDPEPRGRARGRRLWRDR